MTVIEDVRETRQGKLWGYSVIEYEDGVKFQCRCCDFHINAPVRNHAFKKVSGNHMMQHS